jgi:hypothetical protein
MEQPSSDQRSPESTPPDVPPPAAPSPAAPPPAAPSPVAAALRRAGQLMVLLARHLDRAAGDEEERGDIDIDELGRAWVRASQLEQLLRGALPPGSTDSIEVDDPDFGAADADVPGTPGT